MIAHADLSTTLRYARLVETAQRDSLAVTHKRMAALG